MKPSRSVLVVDDEEPIRGFFSLALPEVGFACRTAPTAEAALEMLAHDAFDFILIDIELPGMNGLELSRRIKQEHPRTSIIVMTGHSEQYPYDTALEAGADDFLKKPFSITEVLARIKLILLRQDLHQWAVTDELTGVYNRKGFFTLAQHLLRVSKRTKEEMFLLYADLDNLKTINDTYGHQEGDLALIDAAGILKDNFRESDIVARIGGDEFVVFPVGTSAHNREILAGRFEAVIARHNETKRKPYKLSMSYGFSSLDPGCPLSLDELLIKADREMYRMKRDRKS